MSDPFGGHHVHGICDFCLPAILEGAPTVAFATPAPSGTAARRFPARPVGADTNAAPPRRVRPLNPKLVLGG